MAEGCPGARPPGTAFEQAETSAGRNGLPNFAAWRTGLERRYTVMPPWYWDDRTCRQRYVVHIRSAIDWQQRAQRINRGNADFQRSLAVSIRAADATGPGSAGPEGSTPPAPPGRR
jgi:hypothetical protein